MEKRLKLSDLDLRVLNELQSNCRQSLKELSKKFRVPMSTIHDRVKRLEDAKVIGAYSAVLNGELLGVGATSFVLVSTRQVSSHAGGQVSQREIAREIAGFARVQEVHLIGGEWDLMVKVRGKSGQDIGLFVIDELRQVKGVDRTLTIDSVVSAKETLALDLSAATSE